MALINDSDKFDWFVGDLYPIEFSIAVWLHVLEIKDQIYCPNEAKGAKTIVCVLR